MAYWVEQNTKGNIRRKLLPTNNIQQKCPNFGKMYAKDSALFSRGETSVIRQFTSNEILNPDRNLTPDSYDGCPGPRITF